jgi:hypothetical protein
MMRLRNTDSRENRFLGLSFLGKGFLGNVVLDLGMVVLGTVGASNFITQDKSLLS